MKTRREAAIVLSSRALREADVISTLLGARSGKFSAIAKHARASKKRFFGGVDLFDCATFEFSPSPKNSHLYLLRSASDRKPFPRIRENMTAFALASLCLEISDRFTVEEDPEGAALFPPLFRSLRALGTKKTDNEAFAIATYYSLLVLKISGFHLLDDQVSMDEEVRRWLHEMIQEESPTAPREHGTTLDGFYTIVRYMEETLGTEIRSKEPLQKRVGR